MNAPHHYSISDFMVKFHPDTENVMLWKELDILNPWHMDSITICLINTTVLHLMEGWIRVSQYSKENHSKYHFLL